MSRLSLYLLGPPRIECDGKPVQVDTRKAIALLAYVAITRERHGRDALVNLLWPEYDQTHGRAALRRTLYALRKALCDLAPDSSPAIWLEIDRELIGLVPHADIWLDVDQFHHHLDKCLTHGHPQSEICPACLDPLSAAVELYRDDFMSGFSLKDSFNFDDWQFFQTDTLCREFGDVLDRLVRCHTARGAFEPAIRYARRWLALDRLNESAHAQLMRLYAWSDQRSSALRQYQECVHILESQLGSPPQGSIDELYQAIAAGRTPEPPTEAFFQQPQEGMRAETQTALGDQVAREQELPSLSARASANGAKRLATLLLADVSRSFAGQSGISPEDQASLVDRFAGMMQGVLTRYGARVERALGGSLLAVFGAARTHESDPELAIRAALDIRHEARELGASVGIGISTGEIYIREMTPGHDLGTIPAGRAVDLALCLAKEAPAGQILIAESTYGLAWRAFRFTPLSMDIAGIDRPVSVYQVEGLLSRPGKARGIEGLRAELIGRTEELVKLRELLTQALQGRGQIASLIGEAGVGKSRLVAELREIALGFDEDRPAPLWIEGRCLEVGTAASYAPFIDILSQYFAWGARDADLRRYERIVSSLEGLVARSDLDPAREQEIAALLGHLFMLPIGDPWRAQLANDDPQQIRWRMFSAIRDLIFALCKAQPVVLVLEDLHWADSLSMDLISFLMEDLPTAPILLLCVYRPQHEHGCCHLGTIAVQKCRGRYTEITLHELTHRQSQQMVESLLVSRTLPSLVRELILSRSQGNPFFIEEVVHSLIDAGILYREGDVWQAQNDIGLTAIPESIQSVILSRVDRLEAASTHVLEVASVIGRVFRQRVLARAVGRDVDLERVLWRLEDQTLIYQERTVPEVEYSFKHVLTRETIYHGMVHQRRKSFHEQVAQAIELVYSDKLDEYCEQLAHHYEQSGSVERAIAYLRQAGEKAKRSYANEEAIAHLSKGLALLQTTPPTPERDRLELDLRIALGLSLIYTRGHGAPEVETTYARAQALARHAGDAAQHLQAVVGLRRFYLVRGQLPKAYSLGEQLLAMAQEAGDPLHLSWVHFLQGEVLYSLGDFASSRQHSERALGLYDPQRRRSMITLYGNDVGIGGQLFSAVDTWHLGYPDQSLALIEDALRQARALSHPFILAFALYGGALVHQLRREAHAVGEHAAAVLRIAAERQFPIYWAWGTILRGWARTQAHPPPAGGHVAQGMDEMRQGIAALRDIGANLTLPNWLASLAQPCIQTGQAAAALDLLDEALDLANGNEERNWEPELIRLQGQALLQKGDEIAAEACFQRAIDTARRRQARSWELRATTSLCRLWRGQGRAAQACASLQCIYDQFTEGFDTADLKDAQALLDR